MTRQGREATRRVGRKAAVGVNITEIAETLEVPEAVVRSYLATQTFRGVRMTFAERKPSRRTTRQWRQRPLKGM
jgi:hypothetical protein